MNLSYNPGQCTLCPRHCGATRDENAGDGICAMPDTLILARAALHQWEEPSISGTQGSGTVFFSGCPLQCVYCQNHPISQGRTGQAVSPARLGEIFRELVAQGAHNINLVNPGHYASGILTALETPPPVPVVWNSSGYDRLSTLRALEGRVQIYLPDFKYPDEAAALRYSGAEDYPTVARAAIREMVRQTGPYDLDGSGLLRRGVIIRHLLLPGRVAQAKAVMDWIAETFPSGTVLFSLMSQYTPLYQAAQFQEIARPLRGSEVRTAVRYMEALGLEGYTQEQTSATGDFIPAFDATGL